MGHFCSKDHAAEDTIDIIDYNPADFASLKSSICNNKDKFCSLSKMADAFKQNLRECHLIKHPKTTQQKLFWSTVIDKFNGESLEDDEVESKQVTELLDEFEESKSEEMDKKLSDRLGDFANKLLISLLDAIESALISVQDFQIEFEDFYDTLREIPIFKILLPPSSKWEDVLPPNKDEFKFFNWALTVKSNPEHVMELRSIDDIRKLVAKAQEDPDNIKKVRVSVFKHSFSPLFADNDHLHGLLLPESMTALNLSTPELKYNDELTSVVTPHLPETTGIGILKDNKIRVKAAAANITYTTLAGKRADTKELLWPSERANVLQFFQGYCGTHAVACHGGGIHTTTLCDYVTKLKVINHKGEEVVYEGEVLKNMGAHFGLLGIVTEMEIQYEPPYLALFHPTRRPLDEYFPKSGDCIDFQRDVNENYYNEFFWFPNSNEVFINCFKRKLYQIGDKFERYPSKIDKTKQNLATTAFQTLSQLLPGLNKGEGLKGRVYADLLTAFGDRALKASDDIKTMPSFDALHFQHGIQNTRVLDMEWSFRLNELKDKDGNLVYIEFEGDKVTVPDVSLCRDLWRAAIDLNEKYAKECNEYPQLLPLEMRIIRGSSVNLSCASGAKFVVYIEILTINGNKEANDRFWRYCQDLTDIWGKVGGTEYMRPHWGKYWQGLTVNGKTMEDHLKKTYKDDLKIFNEIREKADPNNIFINNALSKIFL